MHDDDYNYKINDPTKQTHEDRFRDLTLGHSNDNSSNHSIVDNNPHLLVPPPGITGKKGSSPIDPRALSRNSSSKDGEPQ